MQSPEQGVKLYTSFVLLNNGVVLSFNNPHVPKNGNLRVYIGNSLNF